MVRKISLKTRMALAVSLLFVLFSTTISYFSISYFEDKYKQSLASQQYALACAIADDIDDKLKTLQKSLVSVSSKVPPGIIADAESTQRFLDERVTLHTLFDATLFILDREGKLVAESPALPNRRGMSFPHRGYFRKTVDTGKPAVSSPFISSLPDQSLMVILTAPVFDSKGQIACILCGGLRLLGTDLFGDLQATKIGATGYITLTTSDRVMIMHPDQPRIMKFAAPPGVNSLYDRAFAGYDGSGETINPQGIPMLVTYKHLTITDWITALNYPVAEAYAPMHRTRLFMVGGIAAGTFAMLVIVWLVMKRLTTPLQLITRHVAALPEKSGSDKLVPVVSADEIGTLAEAFNGMVSALDRQQEALRESENNFRALAETSSDGMLVISGNGSFTYGNCRIEEITGYSTYELPRHGIRELAHPDDSSFLTGQLKKILICEEVRQQLETRLIRKDGSAVPVELTTTLTLWKGEPAALMIVRDISERKRAEEALRAAVVRAEDEKARTEAIIAAIGEGIIIQDRDFLIIYQNEVHKALIGDHPGEYCYRVYQGRDEVCEDCPVEMAFHDGAVHTVEKSVRIGAETIDIEVTASPLRDSTGEIIACIELVRDITGRKQIENQLMKQMAAIEGSADGIAILNQNGEYAYLNTAHAGMYGYYSPMELVGKTWRALYEDDEIRRFERDVFPVLREKSRWRGEAIGRRRDGTTFPQEVSLSVIEGSGLICVVRDISERKAAEEVIIKLNKDLERRAQELAAANRDLEAFGYSLSHDLKIPLTAIYSAAQILDDVCSGQLDETGRFCVGTICKASERMEELFDAMLHLSRISRRELQRKEIDLSLLTTEILARLKEEEPGRTAEFIIEPALTAHGDAPLLKSALENLLGNAWKYTRKKAVTRIEFGLTEEKGEKVFFIRDNGAGFDMKHAQSLFTPFQRLHREEEFKGTGVGLATVLRIIQLHGGRLWGEGTPGRGATFYFTLPDAPGNADSPAVP